MRVVNCWDVVRFLIVSRGVIKFSEWTWGSLFDANFEKCKNLNQKKRILHVMTGDWPRIGRCRKRNDSEYRVRHVVEEIWTPKLGKYRSIVTYSNLDGYTGSILPIKSHSGF